MWRVIGSRFVLRSSPTAVWQCRAAHPEWKPGQKWDRMVSSDADPLDVPAELRERASAVVLTCPWHCRDAPQLGLPIYVPPPDPPDPDPVRGEVFRGGDTLPFGVCAFEGFEPNDLIHRLRPLLDLPVAVVLPTHADPADRAALEHALSL